MKFGLLLTILLSSFSVWANPGDLVSATHVSDETTMYVSAAREKFCPDLVSAGKAFGFKRYKIIFKTSDLKGNEVESAGLLMIPDTDGTFPMYVYQHGTLFARSELPSSAPTFTENDANGFCLSSLGYVVVMTDYLGFGDGTGVHPYLHAASEAWTGRDMMRASRTALAQLNVSMNSQLFIAGYSQGGHAAMALARMLDQDPTREFVVTAAAPMAGPYALAETFHEIIANPSRNASAEAAYLVVGMNSIYPLYTNLDEVIVPDYVSVVEPLFDGDHGWAVVRSNLSMRPDQLVQPAYLQSIAEDPQQPFVMALRDNEVYHWRPSMPIRLLHGHADNEVPFSNSERAYNYMLALGADVQIVNLGEVNHSQGFPLAIGRAALWFETFH